MRRLVPHKVALVSFTVPILIWLAWPRLHAYWYSVSGGSSAEYGQFGDSFGAFNALFSGLAFVAVAFTIWQSTEEAKREHARQKRGATIQFFSEGHERVYAQRLKLESKLGPDILLKPLSEDDIHRIESADELRLAIHHMMAFFENLSVGVNEDVFDLQTIDKLLGGQLIQAYHSFMPYIRHFRVVNGSERFWDQFEALACVLLSRSSRNDRLHNRA